MPYARVSISFFCLVNLAPHYAQPGKGFVPACVPVQVELTQLRAKTKLGDVVYVRRGLPHLNCAHEGRWHTFNWEFNIKREEHSTQPR